MGATAGGVDGAAPVTGGAPIAASGASDGGTAEGLETGRLPNER